MGLLSWWMQTGTVQSTESGLAYVRVSERANQV